MLRTFLKTSAASLALIALTSLAHSQDDLKFRKFTNAKGIAIQAVVVDKTDTQVSLILENGGRAVIDISTLSDEDQKYVSEWNKAKAYFIQKCRALSVGELLTLRGYEAISIEFDGNSMIIPAEINGKPAKFVVDTGASTSLFHTGAVERTGCKLGPFTEKVYGVSGEVPAAWADVGELKIGESVFKNRKILATDLSKDRPEGWKLRDDGLFGAELLSDLDAVISYQERKLYLRPDNSDVAAIEKSGDEETDEAAQTFRIFKTIQGKSFRGEIVSKTGTVVNVRLTNGKTDQIHISNLSPVDTNYVFKWSEEGAAFLTHCRNLSIKELLELRDYQNFQYKRKGNHIFVDGTLNSNKVEWLIDTGADNSLLHIEAAKANQVEVGPMDQKVYGIGGEAPAAGCMVESVTMGDATFTKRKLLATDMDRFQQGLTYVGLFGADFMRECNAVITYREQRMFLRQQD